MVRWKTEGESERADIVGHWRWTEFGDGGVEFQTPARDAGDGPSETTLTLRTIIPT